MLRLMVIKVHLHSHHFTKINVGGINVTSSADTSSYTTYKKAIEELINAVNKGYKYSKLENDTTNNDKEHYLGSKVSIVSLGANANQIAQLSDYKGDNLKTKYTYDNGNAKVR